MFLPRHPPPSTGHSTANYGTDYAVKYDLSPWGRANSAFLALLLSERTYIKCPRSGMIMENSPCLINRNMPHGLAQTVAATDAKQENGLITIRRYRRVILPVEH